MSVIQLVRGSSRDMEWTFIRCQQTVNWNSWLPLTDKTIILSKSCIFTTFLFTFNSFIESVSKQKQSEQSAQHNIFCYWWKLTCHSRKKAGASHYINDSCIVFSCSGPVIKHTCWLGLLECTTNRAISNVIKYTMALATAVLHLLWQVKMSSIGKK